MRILRIMLLFFGLLSYIPAGYAQSVVYNKSIKKIIVRNNRPLRTQLVEDNTIYEIFDKNDLTEVINGLRLTKRIHYKEQKYYTHERPITLSQNQSIHIPCKCILLDSDKNHILCDKGSYSEPTESKKVFIASRKKRTINYRLSGCLVVPQGSILRFNGGTISNGIVMGNSTSIEANDSTIFDNVHIEGTWRCPSIYSDWFADIHEPNKIDNLFALSNDLCDNVIYINPGEYFICHDSYDSSPFKPKSNTTIVLTGDIVEAPNILDEYYTVYIKDVHNVLIKGTGCIVGDRWSHPKHIVGEKGHGITIQNSRNVTIRGITVKDCWGDCIYVGTSATNHNVKIDSCYIDNGRRTGIAIVNADGYEITNCTISNIYGTPTEYGVDIEPNYHPSHICLNGLIANNKFITKLGLYIQSQKKGSTKNLVVRNNFFDCDIKAIQVSGGDGIDVYGNSVISNDVAISFANYEGISVNAYIHRNFINGTIRGDICKQVISENTINGVCFFEEGCEDITFTNNICNDLVNFAKGKGRNQIVGNVFNYPLEVNVPSVLSNNKCYDVISLTDCVFSDNLVSVKKPNMKRQNVVIALNNTIFTNNTVSMDFNNNTSISSLFGLFSKSSFISGNIVNDNGSSILLFTIDPEIKDITIFSNNEISGNNHSIYPLSEKNKLKWK